MLRNPWRTAATVSVTAVVSSACLSYLYHSRIKSNTSQDSFDIPVRSKLLGPDGRRTVTTQSLPLLTMAAIEDRIKQHASLRSTPRPGGIIWNEATAQLASNNPIEDAHASSLIRRDQDDGDYLFFSVMDGHGGSHTSRLLSKTLIPAVALQLRDLTLIPDHEKQTGTTSLLSTLRSYLSSGKSTYTPFDADPKYVSLAIHAAFAMVDSEIVNAPLRLVAEHMKQSGSKLDTSLPDLSQHPMALASMLPALSGSCALLALLDTAHGDLYVACTGDCRAVAGVWEPSSDGSGNGIWRVDVLSDDQTGRNPSELKRLQAEHPRETETVVQRGRILGGLEPSRAFGDARYKWPLKVQRMLSSVFLEGNAQPMRRPPVDFKTPPYVTAEPVITHRKLDFLPTIPSPETQSETTTTGNVTTTNTTTTNTTTSNLTTDTNSRSPTAPTLRFLILATDGLWDDLSSQDAVALVGAHLSGLRVPSVSRSELSKIHAPTRIGSAGVEGKDISLFPSKSHSQKASSALSSSQGEGEGQGGGSAWTFVDENPGVHLIRNAFGGADEGRLRRLLSIPAPYSRRYRDDVTVKVIWWEESASGEVVGDRLVESVQLGGAKRGGWAKL